MGLWDRMGSVGGTVGCPKDYPTACPPDCGMRCTTFLVGLRGIPMECPVCLQGTWDVFSGQGMLKENPDMNTA